MWGHYHKVTQTLQAVFAGTHLRVNLPFGTQYSWGFYGTQYAKGRYAVRKKYAVGNQIVH